MSEAAAAPAPASAPAPTEGGAPSAPAQPQGGAPESITRHKSTATDRKAAAAAALEAARAGRRSPLAAPPVQPAQLASATPSAATPPPAPAQAPAEPSQDIAKVIQNALAKDRELYEAKQRLKELEQRTKEADEREARRKGMNPLELLESEAGVSLDQIHADMVKGKYNPKSPEQLAAERAHGVAQSAAEELAALKKELSDRDGQARLHAEHAYLRDEIGKSAETHPLLAALDWAPGRVREVYYAKQKELGSDPPLTDVLSSVQSEVEADLQKLLSHDGARKWLQARVAELGTATPATQPEATPPAQLGTQPQSAGRRNDPAALTRVAAHDSGTRRSGGTRSTPSDRKANALRAFLNARSAKP